MAESRCGMIPVRSESQTCLRPSSRRTLASGVSGVALTSEAHATEAAATCQALSAEVFSETVESADGLRPLARLARELRQERGLSQEDLAFRMRDQGAGATSGAVGQIERGVIRPKRETIEALAAALGVEPERFAEYRLAAARRLFDEREVGLEEALSNLRQLEESLERRLLASDREVPPPSTDESPTGRRAGRSRSGRGGRRRKSA